jgi:hypothetical protein
VCVLGSSVTVFDSENCIVMKMTDLRSPSYVDILYLELYEKIYFS